VRRYGDQPVPQLPHGGLVRWLGTRDQLGDILNQMGFERHFLYTSSGPSIGQWWLAHRAGGRLIAAGHVYDNDDCVGHLRAGEVIELSLGPTTRVDPLLRELSADLSRSGLRAVTVGRLMRDANATA